MHLHGRHRAVRRARHRRGPEPREGVRRRDRAPRRREGPARRGGPRGPAVRRVPHPLGRQDLLQHDAARPRRHRHAARARHEGGRRRHLGRRLHLQGQRHRAVLPLRPDGQPAAAHLQAVAGRRVRHRARRPQGDERVARRPGLPLPRLHREGVLDRREHLGRHARGEAARAPRHRARHRRADHGRRRLARRRRDRHRGGVGAVRGRAGPSRSTARSSPTPWPWSTRRTPSAAGTGSAASDQIENRIIEAKSRGIYEAPGHGPAAHRVRAPAQRDPQRGHHRELPRRGPPPRPPHVRGPLARPAVAHAARVDPALGRLGRSPARSRCACAAATTTRSSTRRVPR